MRLHSRNLLDITPRYPEVGRLNRALSHHRAILDGEIVALDAEGRPSFGALQRRMHVGSESAVRRLAKETPVTYVIFDLLWLDGHSLMELPYTERRARLAELELGDGGRWRVPDYVVGHGAQLLAATEQQGLEGVIAKRLDSHLRARAAHAVVAEDQERVAPGGRRRRLGARRRQAPRPHRRAAGRRARGRRLAAPRRARRHRLHGGRARPPGRAAAPAASARTRPSRPAARRSRAAPCSPSRSSWPRSSSASGPTAASCARPPTRACATTSRRRARRARGGQRASLAEVGGRQVKLSNLDKVLYPEAGFAKRDVIDYYARIAPVAPAAPRGPRADAQALPQRRRRAVLLREERAIAPARVGARPRAWGRSTTSWPRTSATLVWLANLADLELHTSLALADDRRAPDARCLRPRSRPAGDGRRVLPRRASCCAACSRAWVSSASPRRRARRACRSTSRSTGEATFAQTKAFSKAVAELLAARGAGARRRAPDQVRAHGQGARRLGPERRQQDDDQRLLAARDATARRCRRRSPGTRSARRRRPRTSPSRPPTCCAASTSTATSSRRC